MPLHSSAPGTALIDRPWPTWKLVLSLAWPALVQQLCHVVVNLSDRYLAGREREVAAQAAQTTAFYVAWFVTCYTTLVSVGSTALVARFIGSGDRARAIRVTNQSLLLAIVFGLLGTTIALSAMHPLLHALQLRDHAGELAAAYLRPMFVLLIFLVIESAGIACLVGAGDTRSGLWVLGSVAIINLPLAWALYNGWGPLPRLGFAGISLGTALAHTLGSLAVLALLAQGRAGLELRLGLMTPDFDLVRRLLRVSVPAAVDSLSIGAAQLWFLGIVNRLGDVAAGAHGIALGWEALGYLSGGAFGVAATALVGQFLGAGRPERASHSGWTAFLFGGSIMSIMGILFFTLARPMFRLFCPGADQTPIVEAGVPVLRLVAFAMPALASCIIFTGALRGAGDTRIPVLFTWFGFFAVRIPLAYWLTGDQLDFGPLGVIPGWNLGLFGAWLAMVADIATRGVFFLARFASGRWKLTRI